MTRDEPTERPRDWSESGVRYRYYRDRGYFKDRPCSYDEYMKWEEWWYKYRDWLAQEGYYHDQQPPSHQQQHHSHLQDHHGGERGGNHSPQGDWDHHHHHHNGWGPSMHRHNTPPPQHHHHQHRGSSPPSRHAHAPPPSTYHSHHRDSPGSGSSGGSSTHTGFLPLSSRANFGRPDGNAYLQTAQHQSIRRRIGRTTNGSLVANIRQGGGTGAGVRVFPPAPPNVYVSSSAVARLQQQEQLGGMGVHRR